MSHFKLCLTSFESTVIDKLCLFVALNEDAQNGAILCTPGTWTELWNRTEVEISENGTIQRAPLGAFIFHSIL